MAMISEGKEGEPNTLLTGSLNTRVALMILSEDRSEIQVYDEGPAECRETLLDDLCSVNVPSKRNMSSQVVQKIWEGEA